MQNPTPFDALLQTIAANHGLNNGLNTGLPEKTAKTAKAGLRKKRVEEDDAAGKLGEEVVPSDEAALTASTDASNPPLRLAQAETGVVSDASAGGATASTPDAATAAGESVNAGAGAVATATSATTAFPWLPILGGGIAIAAAAAGGGGAAATTVTIDTTAPTVTNTIGAYSAATDTLVLTGTNYSTLLETGEDANTDIKARLDWDQLSWDIDGDNATTANVSFALSDISSAKVTDSTHLTIVLTSGKGTALEATTNYAGTTLDTLDITAGFAKDVAGNAATTDAVANAPLFTHAGQATISLGAGYGNLIAPVQVEGSWYYYWDRSGDGTSGGVDYTTHDVLDGIFTYASDFTTTGGDGNTTDTYRYATLNGVNLALPTANGGVAYPQGINNSQNGTSYTDAGASTNGTSSSFNELLAIWDAYNGTGADTDSNGTPTGWRAAYYWSATPSTSGHADVNLNGGGVGDYYDPDNTSVALQVL